MYDMHMKNKVKKVKVTWQEIEKLAKKVSKQVNDMAEAGYQFDAIVCIGRGSMVPSRLISEYTGIKQIYFADAKAYTEDDKLGKVTCNLYMPKLEHKGILLVDDCLATGTTMNAVEKAVTAKVNCLRYAHKIVLFKNEHNLQHAIYGKLYDADKTWLVFPWEVGCIKQHKQDSNADREYIINNNTKYMY